MIAKDEALRWSLIFDWRRSILPYVLTLPYLLLSASSGTHPNDAKVINPK